MNCNLFRDGSLSRCPVAILSVLFFHVLSHAFYFEGNALNQGYFKFEKGTTRNVDIQENLSSNDFSLRHDGARDENIHQTWIYNLQIEKLLRKCIFDIDKVLVISVLLSWFIHSAYQLALPPVWRPSIPIAHRRLII